MYASSQLGRFDTICVANFAFKPMKGIDSILVKLPHSHMIEHIDEA